MAKFQPYINLTTDEIIKADQRWDAFFHLPSKNDLRDESDSELYPSLSLEALQTSYQDYYQILMDCEGDLCDLGAGYGRGSFLSTLLSRARCYSIELSKERVTESKKSAKRLGYDPELFINKSIDEVDIEDFDNYYLYFSHGKALMKFLSNLVDQKASKAIYITESHGEILDIFKNMESMKLEKKFPCSLPRHNPEIHKFQYHEQGESDLEILLKEWFKPLTVFCLEYDHLILNQRVIWKFKAADCILHHQDKFKVEYTPLGRLVDLHDLSVAYDTTLPNIDKDQKLLYQGERVFVEERNGQVRKLT